MERPTRQDYSWGLSLLSILPVATFAVVVALATTIVTDGGYGLLASGTFRTTDLQVDQTSNLGGTVFAESNGTNAVDINGAPTNAVMLRKAASQIDVDNAAPSTLTLYNAGGGTFGLVVSGGESINGALNLNSHLINNVTDPVSAQDAATKHYVDTHPVAGSLAVTVNPDPGGTINLSTGTIGWFYNGVGNSGKPSATTPTTSFRWKALDNGLASNAQTVGIVNTTSVGNYTQGTSFTTTASDDIYGTAMASTAAGSLLANTLGGTLYGWSFHVPVSTTAHTFKIYAVVHGGTATIASHLEDGSHADATATFSAGSGANTFNEIDIAVTAGSPTFLDFSIILTTSVGVSEVGFSAVTES